MEELSLEYLQKELPQRFRTKMSSALQRMRCGCWESITAATDACKEYFKEESLKREIIQRSREKVIHLKTTMRKINQLENPKLKYAYRLAVISGLRVSELADLRPSDLAFTEGRITVTVRNGKGGHGGEITCRQDPILV